MSTKARSKVVSIDGSQGEGGGQILRTSLALSLVTGQPFRIANIRAGRPKPGLLRQHLTAVKAAVEVGDAVVDGAELGSGELVFRPETVKAGEYRFAVGTAGSTTLVLQTILPALMTASAPSRLVLEGGTHNPFAPSFDFLATTFLPQLARFGPQVTATLIRPGFNPAGGGRLEIEIVPAAALQTVEFIDRAESTHRRVIAHLAALSPSIADRAFERFVKRLNWDATVFETRQHPREYGPGFVLTAQVGSSDHIEVFTGFGDKGIRAEQVADNVIDEVRHYLMAKAPVGEYLTDQLMLPMALAGAGAFHSTGLSRHAQTNMEVIAQFLPVTFAQEAAEGGGKIVRLRSS